MSRKTNLRFLLAGVASGLATVLAAVVHQRTGSVLALQLVQPLIFATFILLILLGIAPWANTLALKYPTQNTQGYRDDYRPEPKKEKGRYMSQGYRRRREREGLRLVKTLRWYIEPDEKN